MKKMIVNIHSRGEAGRSAMRDSRGRFVKGHEPLPRPKYTRKKKNPKWLCANCYMAGQCAEYEVHSVCAYVKDFQNYTSRNLESVLEVMHTSLERYFLNLQHQLVLERLSGEINPKVSKLTFRYIKFSKLLIDTYMQIDASELRNTPAIKEMLNEFFMRD